MKSYLIFIDYDFREDLITKLFDKYYVKREAIKVCITLQKIISCALYVCV